MPIRSILPDTGIFVLKSGQWVQVTDPAISPLGVWQTVFEAEVVRSGAWSTSYLRPLPVTITITSPPIDDKVAGLDQLSGSFTGTALDVLGRGVTGTLGVSFRKDGVEQSATTTPITDGAWTWPFDEGAAEVADIGEYDVVFSFADALPLVGSATTSPVFRVNSASVALSITTQPSGDQETGYDSFTVAGTAFREDASVAPGTVYTSWSLDDGTYSPEEAVPVEADGSWSRLEGPFGAFGPRRLRVRYEALPGGFEDPTEVFGNTVTSKPRTPGFTKGTVGETSVAMSTPGVTFRSGYQFLRGTTVIQTSSASSKTDTGRANYTTYGPYKVRAYGDSPSGTRYYSGYSSEHLARTGRPLKTDSGTSSEKVISPAATGSWRTASNNVWGQRGDKVLQGVYIGNSQYGYYRGLIDFGSSGVYNAIKAHLGGGSTGDNRINNGDATYCQVYLWKNPNVGTSGAITIRWFRTNTGAGSNPSPIGSGYDQASATGGNGKWVSVGTTHGTNIVKSKNRGLCMIFDSTSSSRYGEFNGRSSGTYDCRIRMKWTWSYTTQTKISGTWTT